MVNVVLLSNLNETHLKTNGFIAKSLSGIPLAQAYRLILS